MNWKPPTEHREQTELIKWAKARAATLPELEMLVAVPNGEKRNPITGAKLKAQGVKPGFPDLFLPVPRGIYCGLAIEMKRCTGGRLSPEQRDWLERLQAQGYAAVVCNGADEAIAVIENYLASGIVK